MRHPQILPGHGERRRPGRECVSLSPASEFIIVEALRQPLSRTGSPGGFESCRRPAVAEAASPAMTAGCGREEDPGTMRKAARAVLLAAMVAACLVVPPATKAGAHGSVSSTVSASSSVITSSDSSACTVKAASPPRATRAMNENGPGNLAISVNAWLFDASCDGGANSIEIRVHPDFTETEAASAAQKYGKDVGRLPKVLRAGIGTAKGIRILSIHKGTHSWFVSRWRGYIPDSRIGFDLDSGKRARCG